MSSAPFSPLGGVATLTERAWQLDTSRSRVEFEVPHFWGLRTVRGRFTRYWGTLDLGATPSVRFTIDADSIDTGNAKRDRHLRSADFFDVARHRHVRFTSQAVALAGDALQVRGELTAGGGRLDIELDADIAVVEGEYELTASAFVMHRWLGMTWNPAGFTRPYSKLAVAGRLVPAPARYRDTRPLPAPFRARRVQSARFSARRRES